MNRMRQCIVTVGISASGKTTWADAHIRDMRVINEKWVDINRDAIREEVFHKKTQGGVFAWSKWNWKWEKDVSALWDQKVKEVIADHTVHGVVISDTNINPKTQDKIRRIFEEAGFYVRFRHFEISYEEAVKRDLARINPVGSSVIADQIDRYWKLYGDRYVPNERLPKAAVVDVDGTLAFSDGVRSTYDWTRVHLDAPDSFVIDVVRGLKEQGYNIVITSGREDLCRVETWSWLYNHLGFEPSDLFMRQAKDMRKDCIVKKEIFFRDIAPKYNVVGVIDDRPQVVRMWHSIGLRVLACGLQHREF